MLTCNSVVVSGGGALATVTERIDENTALLEHKPLLKKREIYICITRRLFISQRDVTNTLIAKAHHCCRDGMKKPSLNTITKEIQLNNVPTNAAKIWKRRVDPRMASAAIQRTNPLCRNTMSAHRSVLVNRHIPRYRFMERISCIHETMLIRN